MGAAFKSGAARLAITGGNPSLLSNEDPKSEPRQPRCLEGLSAGTGVDYAARDQLDHCGERHAGMGRGSISR